MKDKEKQKLQECLMHIQCAERILRELLNTNNSKESQLEKHELKITEQQIISEKDRISAQLLYMGISPHLLGYNYILDAVILYNKEKCKMMELYEVIAQKNGTNANSVERCIRNAVKLCWEKKNNDKCFELFGNIYSKRTGIPSNSEFIARLSQMIVNEEI